MHMALFQRALGRVCTNLNCKTQHTHPNGVESVSAKEQEPERETKSQVFRLHTNATGVLQACRVRVCSESGLSVFLSREHGRRNPRK